MIKKLLFVFFAFGLAACTHIAATIPTPVVEPPELSGKDHLVPVVDFGASTGGFRYESVADAGARPPVMNSPAVTSMGTTRSGISLEFLERFRAGGAVDILNGGAYFVGQIQVLGAGRSKAKAGNFSLSLFGHGGQNHTSRDGDQKIPLGPGGFPWSSKLKADWYDFGASLGFRVSDAAYIFVGGSKQLSLFQTTVEQTGPAQSGQYYASDKGEAEKLLAGISWGNERNELFLTADYSRSRFETASAVYIGALSIGWRWDLK